MPDDDFVLRSSLDLDVDAAVGFLAGWSEPPWVLEAIEPRRHADQRARVDFAYLSTADAVRDFLTRNHERSWNVYFVPYQPVADLRKTPEKSEVAAVRSLHVDIDLPKPPDPRSSPTIDSYRYLLARLRRVVPPPTVTVFSGGGFQALWRFPVALPAPDGAPSWADRVEAANRAIETALHADHCFNVNRILRLPGTVNVPDFRKRERGRVPAPAYVVGADWSRTWSFDERVPYLAVDPAEADTLGAPDEAPPPQVLADLPAALRRTIRVGDAADWANDRSDMVFSVICKLVRRGWLDAAILPLLLDPAYGMSAHVRAQGDPRTYAHRQLQRARDKVRNDWETDHTGTKPSGRSPANLRRALDELGARFSFDTFALRQYVNGAGPERVVDDHVLRNFMFTIDERFGFLPHKELLNDLMSHLSRAGDYHPVQRYLDSLSWDGVPRIGYPATPDLPTELVPVDPDPGTPSWLTTYGGAEDTPYVRMVGRLFLLAAVRRVRDPGCKFDEMLVLVNPLQGTDKSTALQVLARRQGWFSDFLPFNATPKQVIEQLSGKWIVEASELTGMRRTEIEEMKRFLSSQVDQDRLAWDRYRSEVPRQWICVGTTNSELFLKDSQNRRFWPVRVGRFLVDLLRRDVDQLWAEAVAAEARGESIRLHEHYWGLAAEIQAEARSHEPWVEEIGEVLGRLNGKIVNADVWKILDKPAHARTQEDNRRLGETMRELGFERTRGRVDGQVKIVYARGTAEERQRTIYVFRDPTVRGSAVASLDVNPHSDRPDDLDQLPM